MVSGTDLVKLAEEHVGEAYVLGTCVPKDNANWKGPWDCAEFASWLVYQVSERLYGCSDNAGQPYAADAFTGFWNRDVHLLGTLVTPEVAAGTPGAFLLRAPPPSPGVMGHIVVSDGMGGTLEAMGTQYGVVKGTAIGRRWDCGVIVPWITCTSGAPVPLGTPKVLRLGDSGTKVRELQKSLLAKGFDPGTIDGHFGPHTLAAVTAFQRAAGLVVDGEAGPKTLAAIEAWS